VTKKHLFVVGVGLSILVLSVFLRLAFLQPSHDRDWSEEFAVMPTAEIEGDIVKINNVRNWKYRADGPYEKSYLNRSFNVQDIERVWFLIEPFSGWEGVAHTYFTFDFKNQEPISFSVEARREQGEIYNAFFGFFRKYDLIYLWGQETDFTVNRVITYKDDVYMFPLQATSEFQQQLFIQLAQQTNELAKTPRFYDTFTANCTNLLADFVNYTRPGTLPFHYARFLPGYSTKLLYDLGYIDNSIPLEDLKKKYYLNDHVEELYQEASFSQELRKVIY
jgi:hypothetical protein